MAAVRQRNVANRSTMMEMERALAGARNGGESKFGRALFDVNGTADKVHVRKLKRLEQEMRRRQMHLEQQKKQFVTKVSSFPEPSMIVQRAPSAKLVAKAQRLKELLLDEEYDAFWSEGKEPGYMRPLRSQIKIPSTRTTIDAYTIKPKKKLKTFEAALTENEPPDFQSVVVPTVPLRPDEIVELRKGWQYHKRPLTAGDKTKENEQTVKPYIYEHRKMRRARVKATARNLLSTMELEEIAKANTSHVVEDEGTTFITELPSYRRHSACSVEDLEDSECPVISDRQGTPPNLHECDNKQKIEKPVPPKTEVKTEAKCVIDRNQFLKIRIKNDKPKQPRKSKTPTDETPDKTEKSRDKVDRTEWTKRYVESSNKAKLSSHKLLPIQEHHREAYGSEAGSRISHQKDVSSDEEEEYAPRKSHNDLMSHGARQAFVNSKPHVATVDEFDEKTNGADSKKHRKKATFLETVVAS